MRRFRVPFSLIAIALLGAIMLRWQPTAAAQDATPANEEEMAGVTFELLTGIAGADLPSPADMLVVRVSLEPGASLPGEENDPTVGILLVESGTFTLQGEGEIRVTRGAGFEDVVATAEATGDFGALSEAVNAGEPVTLEAGDSAYLPANVPGDIRNEGLETAVGLIFLVLPPEDAAAAAATPAA